MTWRELLQADAERRAEQYKIDHGQLFVYQRGYESGAQLPNERLLKLIEAAENTCADHDLQHEDVSGHLNKLEIALTYLRSELENNNKGDLK